MRKKFIFLFVICFLSLSTVTSAAVLPNEAGGGKAESPTLAGFTCGGGAFFSDEFNDEVERFKEDDANMAEKFMTSQLQNLWNIGDINGLSTLVFGNPYCVWADDMFTDESTIQMAPDGIFTAVEREKIINPILKMFSAVYVALMALAMMFSGLKLGFSSVRGRGISEFGEDVKMWLISIFFIAGYGIFTNLIFELNAAVVLSFKGLLESQGVNAGAFSIMASWQDLVSVTPLLSVLLVVLAEWILAIVLNFVYIARKVIVLVLLVLGYVAGYSLLFARTRAFFGTWLRELLGNVFLQSIHALLLFGMAMFAATGAGTIYKLGLMMMFIPLTGMISKWLKIGDSSSKMGSALTMIGLGGVMSTIALTSNAGNIIRGGNMHGGINSMSSNNSASSDTSFGGTSLAGAGGGSDSSFTAITTDASGATSESWLNTKNTLSNIGGAVFGAAGMVAGPAGAMLGAKVGKSVTSALVQGPRNIVSGVNSAKNIMNSAKGYSDGNGNTGFKAMMTNLGERRSFYGNMGESLGAMVGAGAAGRKIGMAMSGVSRQRLAATPISEGGRGMFTDSTGAVIPASMQSIARQYPGANMQFVQTNKGSSMWVQTANQDWQQVGLTGAADPLLKNGEARVMDYNLASANTSYELQANGSYKASRWMDSGYADIPNPISSQNATNVLSPSAFVPQASTAIPGMNTPITSQTPVSSSNHSASMVSRLSTLSGQSPQPGTGNALHTPRSVTLNGQPLSPSILPAPTSPSDATTVAPGNAPTMTGSLTPGKGAQVGLPGSTPNVMRTSNAYTVGVGGDGTITQNTLRSVNSVNAVRLSDSGFKPERINPDAFIAHHVPGVDHRTSVDRAADKINSTQQSVSQVSTKVKKSWSMLAKEGTKERSTRIS